MKALLLLVWDSVTEPRGLAHLRRITGDCARYPFIDPITSPISTNLPDMTLYSELL